MKPILAYKNKKTLLAQIAIPFVFLFFILLGWYFLYSRYGFLTKESDVEFTLDETLVPPKCDQSGGIHKAPFFVELEGGNSIYYTVDGSEPSTKSLHYKSPIHIDKNIQERDLLSGIPTSPRWRPPIGDVFKGTVIRAICVTPDHKKSKEFVRTFFVDNLGSKRYTLPILSLTVNKSDLFGYKNGIYVLGKNYEDKRDYIKKRIPLNLPWWKYPSNYQKRGSNAGRPVHIELYEPSGQPGFENKAEVRINGNATRGFSQKSLRITFDKEHGSDFFNYLLFPDRNNREYHSFILRNAGNDWSMAFCRDAIIQSVMKNSALDVQSYRASVVFVNGEYWGIHEIRDRLDENYLAVKYKTDPEKIVILEYVDKLYYGKNKDSKDFSELLDFIKEHSLSDPLNYEHVLKQIDVQNFMDVIIANVYFCNSDWPYNNVRFWKCIENNDSAPCSRKWRWMLYDTDWGMGYTGREDYKLDLLEKARTTGSIGVLFNGLLQNEQFLNAFVQRFNFHLKNTFEPQKVIAEVEKFKGILAPEMSEQINRWRNLKSYEQWLRNMEDLKLFAEKRPEFQVQQLNKFITKYKVKH